MTERAPGHLDSTPPAGADRPDPDKVVSLIRAQITSALRGLPSGSIRDPEAWAKDRLDALCAALQQAREAAERERNEAQQSDEATHAKLRSLLAGGHGETCGCSFDRPDDVCMHHSPKLASLTAELAEARAEIEERHGFEVLSLDLGEKLRKAEEQLAEARAEVIRLDEDLADEAALGHRAGPSGATSLALTGEEDRDFADEIERLAAMLRADAERIAELEAELARLKLPPTLGAGGIEYAR